MSLPDADALDEPLEPPQRPTPTLSALHAYLDQMYNYCSDSEDDEDSVFRFNVFDEDDVDSESSNLLNEAPPTTVSMSPLILSLEALSLNLHPV